MKFQLFALVFTLFTSVVSATSLKGHNIVRPSLTKKAVLKQFNPLKNIEKRGLVDICVALKLDIVTELNQILGIKLIDLVGNVDLCLCVGLLPTFIQTNLEANLAANIVGVAQVEAALIAIIDALPNKKQCSYPDHSQQFCSSAEPCGFSCTNGFTLSSDKKSCQCKGNVCGNTCQTAACPQASTRARSLAADMEKRRVSCPRGYDLCGVPNAAGLGKRGYECLETRSNLESCGGCANPLSATTIPTGKDCTAITNAIGVTCQSGTCVVQACKAPFIPDPTNSFCTLSGAIAA